MLDIGANLRAPMQLLCIFADWISSDTTQLAFQIKPLNLHSFIHSMGLQAYWPVTTHTHHPYHTSQVLLSTSHVLIHPWTTPERSDPVWPLTKGLEPQTRPTSTSWAPHSWIWCRSTYHWSGNCLSSRTKSTGMEVARGNGNVHWTSHMMMMMMIMMLTRHWKSRCEKKAFEKMLGPFATASRRTPCVLIFALPFTRCRYCRHHYQDEPKPAMAIAQAACDSSDIWWMAM